MAYAIKVRGTAVLFALLVGIMSLSACAPDGTVTPPPTVPLATAVPTLTEPPPTATATLSALPAPIDLPTADATLSADLTADDPVALALVLLARRRVATQLDIPLQRVRLLSIDAYLWTDSSLNCPSPDTEPVAQTTPGYRIALQAGSTTYLFHTDVDRVLPCDPENERLPDTDD